MQWRSFAGGFIKRRLTCECRPKGLLFPPEAGGGEKAVWRNKGRQRVTYLTINGRVEVDRVVYWQREKGTIVPADTFLGIAFSRFSPGVRELSCREASSSSFKQASEDLARVGQIDLSVEMVRQLVEQEGRRVLEAQKNYDLVPGWTAQECRKKDEGPSCVITGADGVKVPMITETEKQKRRDNRRRKRKSFRSSCGRRGRKRKGSDQSYKEFKLVAFYDSSHDHQYVAGTSGDHRVLGRLMRREAGSLRLDQADVSYSVSDGAEWIRRQYQSQLPMLTANILDYFHLRDHLIVAARTVFGEESPQGAAWRKEMSGCVIEKGPVELLCRIRELRQSLRSPVKRQALDQLTNYVAPRVEMLNYKEFLSKGYEIGSGPTESFCKTLTGRLKGSGMRWDKPNAEALMALAAIRQSNLWKRYWKLQQASAA